MSSGAAATGSLAAGDDPKVHPALVLATLTFVTMLYAMTVTIANVSLPQMRGSLSATQDQIAWVVTLNIVATAVVTPMAAWLAARLGRRRLMIWGILGFGVSSILCGLAGSVEELVLYRIGQGAFGAPLVPLSQAIVIETFTGKARSNAMTIWGTGVIMGPIIAPALGGALSEAFSWRWVFFMLVPFTAAALIGVIAFIKGRSTRGKVSLDWFGFAALALAVTSLQLMLDRGERNDWFESWEITIWAAIALSAFYLFIMRNRMSDKPFLNPGLLRDRNFVLGCILIFIFGMLNFTPITLLPTLMQDLQGYPDSVIGWVLSARGAGTLVGFVLMYFTSKLDPRLVMAIGFGLQGYAGWLMAGFNVNVSLETALWIAAVQGFGVGLCWITLALMTFSTLRTDLTADGTAIFHLVRNMGSSIFISLSIAVVIRMTQTSTMGLTEQISVYNENLRLPWVAGAWRTDSVSGLAHLQGEAVRQAAMVAYNDAFLLFAATCALTLPLICLLRWRREG